jgi:hypothetical protein
MNKKFAFIVVLKGPRKMVIRTGFKYLNVQLVSVNLEAATEYKMKFYGKNILKGNKPMLN